MTDKTANEAWIDTLKLIIGYGDIVQPRGELTKEVMSNLVQFNMNYPICYHQNRRLNYAFMAREAWTITGGSNAVSDIEHYNPHIAQFSDNGISFTGHYGPMFIYQRGYVIETLIEDIHSRRATMTIWKPNPRSSFDYPCTLTLNWLVRNGQLNCFVTMRSSDAWLGLPYDMFVFTCMTLNILNELNLRAPKTINLGTMYLSLASSHLYEHNLTGAYEVVKDEPDKETKMVPSSHFNSWDMVRKSLTACFDKLELSPYMWEIRPND